MGASRRVGQVRRLVCRAIDVMKAYVRSNHKRLLILSGRYSEDGQDRWLLQELAEELCRRGHEIDLLILDPTGQIRGGQLETCDSRLRAYQVQGFERSLLPRYGTAKYLPQALRIHLDPRVRGFFSDRYDACLFTTPGVVSAGIAARLKRSGQCDSTMMIMWDFFPVTNTEVGAIRGGRVGDALFKLEQMVVRSADDLVLMTPRGERFLDSYYTEVPGRRTIIPPWGRDETWDHSTIVKRERFTVVWGGQIVKGRALDDLIHVAGSESVMSADIAFVIAGDGPDRPFYENLVESLALPNVHFLGQVPRQSYARLLRECHVGVTALRDLSTPSFPSKTVDYCRAGLPILAAVESGTDYGEIIEAAGAGVSVPSGDRDALTHALVAMAEPAQKAVYQSMTLASRRFFERHLDVRVAATQFEAMLSST